MIITHHAKLPTQLDLSEIIVLFNKGDLLDCNNYRPICLLYHVYKLVTMILYRKISSELRRALSANQSAYQKVRSTIEQIQSLQQIIDKVNEFNRQGIMCFIDFKKAFDSVYQEKLGIGRFYIIKKSINRSYINLFAKMYENSSSRIRNDLGITRNVSIRRGVKQGDLPSALLVLFFMRFY